MGALIYNLTTAALMVLMFHCGTALVGEDTIRARRIPWVAAGLLLLALVGVAVRLLWDGGLGLLDHDPGKSGWWRPLTAVFLQDGILGTVWNLVTLAVMAALAEWFWGGRLMVVLFMAGALLPEHLDALLGATGHSTDPRNFIGSSGATYFLSATLAGALALRGAHRASSGPPESGSRLRTLTLSLAVPITGLLMWFAQGNGHGLVSAEGFVLGGALWALTRQSLRPERDLADPPETTIGTLLALLPPRQLPRR